MYSCVKHNVPFVLTGSIRDDGPLPDVITDALEAQDAMRRHAIKATMAILIATALHAIATGNMLPAFVAQPDGTMRELPTICVDSSEFVVSKLKDRGTHQAFGVVTNAQDFMHILRLYVERELESRGASSRAKPEPVPRDDDAHRKRASAFSSRSRAQVPAERIAEIHFFQPIKQGGVESGVAVVAAWPETVVEPGSPSSRANRSNRANQSRQWKQSTLSTSSSQPIWPIGRRRTPRIPRAGERAAVATRRLHGSLPTHAQRHRSREVGDERRRRGGCATRDGRLRSCAVNLQRRSGRRRRRNPHGRRRAVREFIDARPTCKRGPAGRQRRSALKQNASPARS